MAKEEQIKTSIDLTGEKEYRAACNSINSSLREIEFRNEAGDGGVCGQCFRRGSADRKNRRFCKNSLTEQAKKAEAAEEALKKMRDSGH